MVLRLSATVVAGEKCQGCKGGLVGWHGSQGCTIPLANRKLRVRRPWLRRKGRSEGRGVVVPAYEAHYPYAARSLLRAWRRIYHQRLKPSPSLCRCLGTTNVIESPLLGVRLRTRRISLWRDGKMEHRWAASAFLATEKNFRRIHIAGTCGCSR